MRAVTLGAAEDGRESSRDSPLECTRSQPPWLHRERAGEANDLAGSLAAACRTRQNTVTAKGHDTMQHADMETGPALARPLEVHQAVLNGSL